VICKPCAELADFATDNALNEGHPPEVCLDNGRDIRACGCQHRPVTSTEEPTDA
jgi:hypothetical protein